MHAKFHPPTKYALHVLQLTLAEDTLSYKLVQDIFLIPSSAYADITNGEPHTNRGKTRPSNLLLE